MHSVNGDFFYMYMMMSGIFFRPLYIKGEDFKGGEKGDFGTFCRMTKGRT